MKSNFQILAILSLFFALVLAGRQRPVNPSLGGNNRIDSAMLVDCCHPEYDGKCLDGSKPNPDCGVGEGESKYLSAMNIHDAVRQIEKVLVVVTLGESQE
ncbi:hypothetical protein TESG_05608 [Trichophyton tonsurans CBS 112818]|uniref:Uncharacterized protein n=1 Tax=Trichophyton tonsurans (strain CBS 112818) TaxID=647933 RepID=F2S3S8_TRIT1|nr:hypothetical protein TESG_05608 [Trichophyton tonsurans CBS 112818]